MRKERFKLFFLVISLFVLLINTTLEAAHKGVAMIRDIKGDVWFKDIKSGEKIKATYMLELKEGDILIIGNGSESKVFYYYSETEEKYLENSLIKIGERKGELIKGKVIPVENNWDNDNIKIIPEVYTSPAKHENIGAFTLRGNQQPVPSEYFNKASINRYAVIIGISEFKDTKIPALKYADQDAQSFCDYLVSPYGGSFNDKNIVLLKNKKATLKNVKNALTNFLKKANDNDFVIVYIASHGEPEPDRPKNLYLLTYDSELDNLASTAYLMDYVNADMKRYISAKRLIFFADACHAGSINSNGFGTRGFSNTINNALSALSSTREGWAMITSSRTGEVALESDKWGNGHGAFTFFLLEGLYGKADIVGNYNGIITITEAFDYAENMVKYATQNAQHPVITGDFDNNLPIGFIPAENVNENSSRFDNKTDNKSALFNGTIRIGSSESNANIFIDKEFVGKTSSKESFVKEIPAGSVMLTIKKEGLKNFERLVCVNPNETSNIYAEMRSTGVASNSHLDKHSAYKYDFEQQYEKNEAKERELKSNIDKLVKELEEIKLKQMAIKGHSENTEIKPGIKIENDTINKIEQPNTIPISIKQFTTNMKALYSKRIVDKLRMGVIDELIKSDNISIVERDLQYQEEILREQRLGGSIIADQMYRIEIGKILGANYICFSHVYTDYDSNDLVLRMEVVESATTLVDFIDHRFNPNDLSLSDSKTIATKIIEIIKRKKRT